jgi:hypothetical protein
MPFGSGVYEAQGETHPSHGETSGAQWSLQGSGQAGRVHSLHLALNTSARVGRVERIYSLVDGENAVYDSTIIHGFSGPMTMGHHAVLRAPAGDERLRLSTSGIAFGSVYPFPFGSPCAGEYQGLEIGAPFKELESVSSTFKGRAAVDCSLWPGLEGFTDLLQVATKKTEVRHPAWVAAVNASEGYIWFALKDADVLPSTIFWRENHGRHGVPWLGRNCALGIEDVCTYFDRGIAESSAPNMWSERGVRTHHDLSGEAFDVRYIQGVARCPEDFGKAVHAEFSAHEARFYDADGREAIAAVQPDFLFGNELAFRSASTHPRNKGSL